MRLMYAQECQKFLKKIGRRIGELRAEDNYTQSRLAEKAGVSVQMVQYWESGRNITLKTLYNLSHFLDQPVARFLEEPKSAVARRGRPRRKVPVGLKRK